MHIPDGYLSPSTCAVLYAGAVLGWYGALRRIKRTLNARMVPLISVFAAFSFVVMMFNLPLPGGTTGHALGVTIAAHCAWAPQVRSSRYSIALAIQALVLRRRRHHHPGRKLLQHGDGRLAGRPTRYIACLPSGVAIYFAPSGRRGRDCRLSGS